MPQLSSEDVKTVFGLPPARAVAFLRDKGFQITENWEELLDDAHAKVFTIAKVIQLDMLEDIHTTLVTTVESGKNRRQTVRELKQMLVRKGWLEGDENKITRRLKTIYQTNIQSAYMAGRHRSMLEAVETHPYWQYIAVLDGKTRRSHAALHGRVYRYDDDIWGVAFPPNGWNCRCRTKPVSLGALKRRGIRAEKSAIKFVEREIGVNKRTGEIRTGRKPKRVKVAEITVKDRSGRDVIFSPDTSFNSSPVAAFVPDLKKYPKELAAVYQQLQNNYRKSRAQ